LRSTCLLGCTAGHVHPGLCVCRAPWQECVEVYPARVVSGPALARACRQRTHDAACRSQPRAACSCVRGAGRAQGASHPATSAAPPASAARTRRAFRCSASRGTPLTPVIVRVCVCVHVCTCVRVSVCVCVCVCARALGWAGLGWAGPSPTRPSCCQRRRRAHNTPTTHGCWKPVHTRARCHLMLMPCCAPAPACCPHIDPSLSCAAPPPLSAAAPLRSDAMHWCVAARMGPECIELRWCWPSQHRCLGCQQRSARRALSLSVRCARPAAANTRRLPPCDLVLQRVCYRSLGATPTRTAALAPHAVSTQTAAQSGLMPAPASHMSCTQQHRAVTLHGRCVASSLPCRVRTAETQTDGSRLCQP
jgi:hypothetical protein